MVGVRVPTHLPPCLLFFLFSLSRSNPSVFGSFPRMAVLCFFYFVAATLPGKSGGGRRRRPSVAAAAGRGNRQQDARNPKPYVGAFHVPAVARVLPFMDTIPVFVSFLCARLVNATAVDVPVWDVLGVSHSMYCWGVALT